MAKDIGPVQSSPGQSIGAVEATGSGSTTPIVVEIWQDQQMPQLLPQ